MPINFNHQNDPIQVPGGHIPSLRKQSPPFMAQSLIDILDDYGFYKRYCTISKINTQHLLAGLSEDGRLLAQGHACFGQMLLEHVDNIQEKLKDFTPDIERLNNVLTHICVIDSDNTLEMKMLASANIEQFQTQEEKEAFKNIYTPEIKLEKLTDRLSRQNAETSNSNLARKNLDKLMMDFSALLTPSKPTSTLPPPSRTEEYFNKEIEKEALHWISNVVDAEAVKTFKVCMNISWQALFVLREYITFVQPQPSSSPHYSTYIQKLLALPPLKKIKEEKYEITRAETPSSSESVSDSSSDDIENYTSTVHTLHTATTTLLQLGPPIKLPPTTNIEPFVFKKFSVPLIKYNHPDGYSINTVDTINAYCLWIRLNEQLVFNKYVDFFGDFHESHHLAGLNEKGEFLVLPSSTTLLKNPASRLKALEAFKPHMYRLNYLLKKWHIIDNLGIIEKTLLAEPEITNNMRPTVKQKLLKTYNPDIKISPITTETIHKMRKIDDGDKDAKLVCREGVIFESSINQTAIQTIDNHVNHLEDIHTIDKCMGVSWEVLWKLCCFVSYVPAPCNQPYYSLLLSKLSLLSHRNNNNSQLNSISVKPTQPIPIKPTPIHWSSTEWTSLSSHTKKEQEKAQADSAYLNFLEKNSFRPISPPNSSSDESSVEESSMYSIGSSYLTSTDSEETKFV